MEWRNRAFYVFGGVELLLDFLGVGDVFFVVAAERAERVVEVFGGGVMQCANMQFMVLQYNTIHRILG